jgi:uncharacterized BrkB/YihY/UPF0761 family membrane protein
MDCRLPLWSSLSVEYKLNKQDGELMSLGWVIAGTVGLLMLGSFLLLFTIFAGAGIANTKALSEWQSSIITFSIYALPSICFLSAGVVIYLYKNDAGSSSYWWYTVPAVAIALYAWFVSSLSR